MADPSHLNAVAVCACFALPARAAKQAAIALRLFFGVDDEDS